MDLCNFHISSHGHMTLGPTKPLIHHSSMLIHKTEPIKHFLKFVDSMSTVSIFQFPTCRFALLNYTALLD